jgi:hypothetical protein
MPGATGFGCDLGLHGLAPHLAGCDTAMFAAQAARIQ